MLTQQLERNPLATKEDAAACSTAWVQRFAECLLLLHPRTIAVTAAKHVAATSPEARALSPEDAAARFICDSPHAGRAVPH